jgi:hypothetical protein
LIIFDHFEDKQDDNENQENLDMKEIEFFNQSAPKEEV